MNQSAGDSDTLAHAAREGADKRVAAFDETDFAEKFRGTSGRSFDILEFGEEEKIFFGGEFVVDHSGVRDIAGTSVIGRLGCCAGESKLARGGLDDLRGDAKQRGFTGAVAAREDNAFAGSDGEGDAAEGEQSAITLVNILEAKTGWRHARGSHGRISGAAVGR